MIREKQEERKMTGRRGMAETEILEEESPLVRTRQDHRNEKTKPLKERNVRNSEDSKW